MENKKVHYIFLLILLFAVQYLSFSQPVEEHCRIVSVVIPDHSTRNDSLFLNINPGSSILDLNLKIDTLIHTWVGDLSMYLRKGNLGVRVFNKTGASGDNFIGTIFNDSASIIIDSASAPFTGNYRPNNPLSVFNNILNPHGYWLLSTTDTAGGDTGVLKKWCLIVKYSLINGGIQTVEIPNTYRLYQNYPNPFNPVSKIKYGVPKNGYVKLAVYDEIGRLVAILQDGVKQANTYEAEFDATNLPSGVYYYKLEAEGFSETKKMVVVK